ncbi:MAG: ribosome maturation factor RimM, partial [Gammaproteobacteria bacterium]|nr:ribosome maturation factor RimM [Gammaproteobacteria bacterium]
NPEQLKNLSGDEYYWRELIGLRVVNQQGVELGVVESLFETGANDVLVVKDGTQERLVPWTLGHAVLEVDMEQGVILVDWDEDF